MDNKKLGDILNLKRGYDLPDSKRKNGNRCRIELLERSARLLYKEWFVYFRYPGHEHETIGSDGIPEGWEKVKISDLCVVGRGASPRPIQKFLDGSVPWFKIGDATQSGSPFVFETKEKVTEDGANKSVNLDPMKLILSNSATCGIPFFTGVQGCIHDGWLYFKNLKRISKFFLYCCLASKQRELLSRSGKVMGALKRLKALFYRSLCRPLFNLTYLAGIGEGATQKNLNTKYIGNVDIVLPKSDYLLSLINENIEPIFISIFTLAKQNQKLQKARDLLLPRLMNGEITV